MLDSEAIKTLVTDEGGFKGLGINNSELLTTHEVVCFGIAFLFMELLSTFISNTK